MHPALKTLSAAERERARTAAISALERRLHAIEADLIAVSRAGL